MLLGLFQEPSDALKVHYPKFGATFLLFCEPEKGGSKLGSRIISRIREDAGQYFFEDTSALIQINGTSKFIEFSSEPCRRRLIC